MAIFSRKRGYTGQSLEALSHLDFKKRTQVFVSVHAVISNDCRERASVARICSGKGHAFLYDSVCCAGRKDGLFQTERVIKNDS
jgi:glucokinase